LSSLVEKISGQRTESNVMRMAHGAARLIMAGIFIYASIDKIAHPAAFAKDVYNYQILPDALVNLTALVLPWLELLLGLCLLAGVWMPGVVLWANGLLLVFLAALLFNMAGGWMSTAAASAPAATPRRYPPVGMCCGTCCFLPLAFFFFMGFSCGAGVKIHKACCHQKISNAANR